MKIACKEKLTAFCIRCYKKILPVGDYFISLVVNRECGNYKKIALLIHLNKMEMAKESDKSK